MEEMGIKAIIIGISMTVTLVILSLVVVSFDRMTEIFAIVKGTDNAIHTEFDRYVDGYIATYDKKTMTGVDLLNALKKAEQEEEIYIDVRYPGYTNVRDNMGEKRESHYLKELMKGNKKLSGITYKYQEIYNVTVSEEGNKVIINFEKAN